MKTSCLPASALLITHLLASPALFASTPENCTQLSQQTFADIRIETTETVTDRPDLPTFCAVRGTIEPTIGFEMRLPLEGWNGKLFQSGCGGYCGSVLADKPGWSNGINGALQKGYAAITTDAGHDGGLGEAAWALDNPQAVALYAHESIPLTDDAAQQLLMAFYGNEPQRNYFGGCSNGGRMAAMAAQRYPERFDGVFAGGSVLNLSQNGGIFGSWVVQSNTTSDGQGIITAENFAARLPLLEAQVLAQCDASDGEVDGRISQPRACSIDLEQLPKCGDALAGEERGACFSDAERGVLQRWYQGPRNAAGQQLYPGMPPGSERFWLVWFLDPPGQIAPGNALGGNYARYLGFAEEVPAGYSAMDFDFEKDPARLVAKGELLDAIDPNLTAFRDAGGKLLMWHGWQDPLVLPDQSVAYYENLEATMGGRDAVQDFARLFMIPGQGHCWELSSDLPEHFDPLSVLERWVEEGQAPDQLLLTRPHSAPNAEQTAVVCPHPIDANSCSR